MRAANFFIARLAHSAVSGVSISRPANSTARNTGPVVMPETESQPQMIAARNSDALPLTALVGLAAPDMHPKAVGHVLDIGDGKSHQFRAAQRGREAEAQERAVAVVDQPLAAAFEHAADDIVRGRSLRDWRRANRAPDAAHDGIDARSQRRRVLDPRLPVHVANGRAALVRR